MIKARKKRNCSPNKRQKKKNIVAGLPDDTIFGILTRLPVTCLFRSMRYVCNSWASIIRDPSFAKIHLRNAKPGLFIQSRDQPHGARFLEIKSNGDFEITNLSSCYPGRFVDSVDGLALFETWWSRRKLYVANPVTMQFVEVTKPENCRGAQTGIARAPRSGELKLVSVLKDHLSCRYHWHVLRLGMDSTWRKTTSIAPMRKVGYVTPLYIGGYLYWIQTGTIMVMDVDQEAVRLYRSPRERAPREFHKMGDYLSFARLEYNLTMEILFLDVDSGNWTCYHRIDFRYRNPPPSFKPLFFQVGVDQQLIIYAMTESSGDTYIAYDMKTQKVNSLGRFISPGAHIRVHTNSLLPPL